MNEIETKSVSEREILVGENKIYLNEDNIVHFIAVGEPDKNVAIDIGRAIIKLCNTIKGNEKINVLVDLTKAGKPSREAREIFGKYSTGEKAGRTAFFGLSPVARVLSSFFIETIRNNKNMCFFKTKEEALAWLKK